MNRAKPAFVLQAGMNPVQSINYFLNSPLMRLQLYFVALFFVVLWLPLAYWAFHAGQRGTSRYFRGAADPIFPFFETLIYVWRRITCSAQSAAGILKSLARTAGGPCRSSGAPALTVRQRSARITTGRRIRRWSRL